MKLPPGPVYIIQNLPYIVLPPALTLLTAKALPSTPIPTWALVLAAVLSLPIAWFLQIQYRDFRDAREARKLGAVLPPVVKSRLPGGLDVLRRFLDNLSNGYPGDLFVEFTKDYGHTFNFRILFENRFFTTEPEYIKAILASQFENFEKGRVICEQNKVILGTGVFNSDGDMWKFHRSMTRPFFSKERISHFDIFDRHATEALRQLKARLAAGFPVDIQDLASRFTMDSATEFLFAQDVRSLDAGLPYPYYAPPANSVEGGVNWDHPANVFSRAFDEAQRLVALRARRGVNWPLSEFWRDEVEEKMVVVKGFIGPIMRAAVEKKRAAGEIEKKDGEREVKEGESLLDHLINYTEDETVLRDEILNILLAGRDTTTNSITFAIYMLSEHPEILQRLRQEVLDTVGETRRPTFEDMKDMKFLRAVINETLRLYPAVPFNARMTNKPVVLPGKYGNQPFYLPEGGRTAYSVFLMHRRKDLWGPDADEFDPDRFLDERLKKYLTPNPFIFLPFNAGPRICLGQQFAYHETSFFLIRLLQQFSSITHVVDAQPPASRPPRTWAGAEGTKGRDKLRLKTYLTMSARGGCWVTLEEAKREE